MKIDLFDINKFIKENSVQEIKSPIFFQYDGTPTPNGLFSYEIFGITDKDRKSRFGYIDLGAKYIHPLIFGMLTSRMGVFKRIIYGERYAIVVNRKIQIVPESDTGAMTGIDFFYHNFDKISWIDDLEEQEEDSLDKKTRLKFLKHITKDEFFIDKWLVLPPFYRSENSQDKTMGDAINGLYKDLINKSASVKTGFTFDLFGYATKMKTQNLLHNIYLSTIAPLSGKHLQKNGSLAGTSKNSMLRRNLLGKNIDFTASNVITSPSISLAETPKDIPVPFGYAAYPLPTLMSLFHPFFVNETVSYMEEIVRSFATSHSSIIKNINIYQYSIDRVEKLVKRFVKSEGDRFDTLGIVFKNLNDKDEEMAVKIDEYLSELDYKNGKILNSRTLTVTDVFYQVALTVLKDKHVYVTRYPVTNFQNIYPTKIKILSTVRTRKKLYIGTSVGIQEFENYPHFPETTKNKKDVYFYNVLIPGNYPLAAIGGDYDGDMLYLKSVFSLEANKEADKLIKAKTNILGATGRPSRGLGTAKDAVVGLYVLTKD